MERYCEIVDVSFTVLYYLGTLSPHLKNKKMHFCVQL